MEVEGDSRVELTGLLGWDDDMDEADEVEDDDEGGGKAAEMAEDEARGMAMAGEADWAECDRVMGVARLAWAET